MPCKLQSYLIDLTAAILPMLVFHIPQIYFAYKFFYAFVRFQFVTTLLYTMSDAFCLYAYNPSCIGQK